MDLKCGGSCFLNSLDAKNDNILFNEDYEVWEPFMDLSNTGLPGALCSLSLNVLITICLYICAIHV